MREATLLVSWLGNSGRCCVRQAAGHGRLVACAPQRFGFPVRKQRQRRVVFLACAGAERVWSSERIEPVGEYVVSMLLDRDQDTEQHLETDNCRYNRNLFEQTKH